MTYSGTHQLTCGNKEQFSDVSKRCMWNLAKRVGKTEGRLFHVVVPTTERQVQPDMQSSGVNLV